MEWKTVMSVNVSICCTTADKAWWFDLEMEDATRLRVKKKRSPGNTIRETWAIPYSVVNK